MDIYLEYESGRCSILHDVHSTLPVSGEKLMGMLNYDGKKDPVVEVTVTGEADDITFSPPAIVAWLRE